MSTTENDDRPVTRDDIEAKLRELRGEVDQVADAGRGYVVAAGAVLVLVAVGAAFVLGRRKGRRRATVVEVRRV